MYEQNSDANECGQYDAMRRWHTFDANRNGVQTRSGTKTARVRKHEATRGFSFLVLQDMEVNYKKERGNV